MNELKIINMDDLTDTNLNIIINKINSNEINTLNDLNNIINEKAYTTYNNQLVNELDFTSKEFKKINKESLSEIINSLNYILPDKCKIKSDNINITKIEDENKLNELINLINEKFNIINKIL